MGRITTNIRIESFFSKEKAFDCTALVDTGAAYLTLPLAWKERLGAIETIRKVEHELANQEKGMGEVCGPVNVVIENFDPIYTEILFMDMKPSRGSYEPLLGYIPLEQSALAVDMLGHRLVPLNKFDLK